MSVETTETKVKYHGNGSSGPWAINFPFTEPKSILAIRVDSSGVEHDLVYGTDYTVTKNISSIGGEATVLVQNGETLTLYREEPLTQKKDFRNFGPNDLEEHERALDKLTLISQQLSEAIDRAVKTSIASDIDPDQLVQSIFDAAIQVENDKNTVDEAMSNLFSRWNPLMTTVDGQTDYTFQYPVNETDKNALVVLNGLVQDPDTDYTFINPTTIRFNPAPPAGQPLRIITSTSASNPDLSGAFQVEIDRGKVEIDDHVTAIVDDIETPETVLSLFPSLTDALADIGAKKRVLVVDRDETLTATVTIPTNVTLRFVNKSLTVTSGYDLLGLHNTSLLGRGSIKFMDGGTFYTRPNQDSSFGNKNTLYLSPSGSDSNSGLTPTKPFRTFQKAMDVLLHYSPISGFWEINLASGTYGPAIMSSYVRMERALYLVGPDVSGGVPTAVIDGAGSSALLTALNYKRLYIRDLKFTNSTGDGLIFKNHSQINLKNVHVSNTAGNGILFQHLTRAEVEAGIVENCRVGIRCIAACSSSIGLVNLYAGPTVRNCSFNGIELQEGCLAHIDSCTIDGNINGIQIERNSRATLSGNDIKSNSGTGVQCQLGGYFFDDTAVPNNYNVGLPTENGSAWECFDGNRVSATQGYSKPHKTTSFVTVPDVTHTGTTSEITIDTPITIPAGVFYTKGMKIEIRAKISCVGTGGIKQLRIRFNGKFVALLTIAGAGPSELVTEIYAKTSNSQFIQTRQLRDNNPIDVVSSETTNIDMTIDQTINVTAQLANAADSMSLEALEVKIIGF